MSPGKPQHSRTGPNAKLYPESAALEEWCHKAADLLMITAAIFHLPTLVLLMPGYGAPMAWWLRDATIPLYLVLVAVALFRTVNYRTRLLVFFVAIYVAVAIASFAIPRGPYSQVGLVTVPILVLELLGHRSAAMVIGARVTATSSAGNALDLGFSYFGNGSAQTESNNLNNAPTHNFTYDVLNRLATAQTQATSGQYCWGQSIPTDGTGFDQYGNLLKINPTQCSTPALNLSVNTNNRITNAGFNYDAAGNLTSDNVYAYAWDAENHLASSGTYTFAYDGDGRKVYQNTGTLYFRAPDRTDLAEVNFAGNADEEYIYFGGRRLAERDGRSGNVFYYFPDVLGSTRTLTDATGHVCYDGESYPFGRESVYLDQCAGQSYQQQKFAGMEYDPPAGYNYYTQNRFYEQNLVRWMTPDPLAGDITNHQSLNRYAYALNNPTTLTDPSGLDACQKAPDPRVCRIENYYDLAGSPGLYWQIVPDEFDLLAGGGGIGPAPVGGGGVWSEAVPPFAGGGFGLPCDFPPCGAFPISPYTTNPVETPPGSAADYVMKTFVLWPFLPNATPSAWPGVGWGPNGFYAVLPASNYCGPGNRGYGSPALNAVDAACMGHDLRYGAVGISAANKLHVVGMTAAQKAAMKAADAQLCKDLAKIIFYSPQESANLFYVEEAFGCQ